MSEAMDAVGAPVPFETVEISGVRLAYWSEGEGFPLVCLHATGHGARDFEGLPSLLPKGVRVIAVDWPGQGRSGIDTQAASAARYATLLEGFLDALALDRVVLLGNSIGGAAAIIVAARRPERVAALILADPGGLVGVNAMVRGYCRAMARFFDAGVKGRRWFAPAFGLYYRTILKGGTVREHRARIVAAGYDHAPALAQAWRSFAEPSADIRHLAPSVTCPVLFTWAKHDRVLSAGMAKPAIARFPHAELRLFNGGHCAFLEDAQAFGKTIGEFLAGLSA